MRLLWMRQAEDQLEEIYQFEAQKNPRFAAEVYNRILDSAERLRSFPEMAPREPSLAGEKLVYRALLATRRHKVIYRFDPMAEQIIVVSVWDCRQDPETLKTRVAEPAEV